MTDEHLTAQEVTRGAHSYRNFSPEQIPAIVNNPALQDDVFSNLSEAQAALRFIESGRFNDFLEAVSEFFFKLDNDEAMLFTRRNPDTVEWMTVWNEANGLDPMTDWRETARDNLTGDRQRAADPPPFTRKDLGQRRDDLLKDMMFRRRSYRNWTPGEFHDIIDREQIEVTGGMALELDLWTIEAREEINFPTDAEAKWIARVLFERIEAGRFDEAVSEAQNVFLVLDKDERLSFARRNPGLIMWMDARGRSQHMPHGEQLFPFTDDVLPTLAET